jgi:hypothetical protein
MNAEIAGHVRDRAAALKPPGERLAHAAHRRTWRDATSGQVSFRQDRSSWPRSLHGTRDGSGCARRAGQRGMALATAIATSADGGNLGHAGHMRQSVEAMRNAVSSPEFQKSMANSRPSSLASPHTFAKVAVEAICGD